MIISLDDVIAVKAVAIYLILILVSLTVTYVVGRVANKNKTTTNPGALDVSLDSLLSTDKE